MKLEEVKLKDISINNRGYYGIGASAVAYDENKYTYLRITDINNDGTLNAADLMSVDDKNARDFLLQKNDIVFARTGASTGRNYFYDGEINNMVFAGFLIKFSLDEEKVNPKFIKYYCLSQKYRNWIASSLTGSTRPNINERQLAEMPITIPNRDYQDKIVKILDAITKKVRLNNQINDNLLKFGLGLITEEMKKQSTKELRNIIKFIKGKKPINISEIKKDKYLSYLTIANLNNQENLYASTENVIIADNDLLMVMDGASSGDVYYSDYGIVGSTLAKIDIIDTSYNQASIYFILKYFSEYIKSKNTGSAIPHTDKEIVYKLVIPDIDNQKKYENILKNILQLNKQNKILEQLRDTLLPKLMNGEIDLDKIEI